jgi:hypothetical protein
VRRASAALKAAALPPHSDKACGLQMTALMRRLFLVFLFLPAAALTQSGVWGLRGITRRFVVQGDLVYAIDGRGIAVYDANTLHKVADAETETESVDAAFAGDTLTVATRAGFERFTVNPLKRFATVPVPAATRVASNGRLVAAAGSDGIRIYDGEQLIASWTQTQRITALVWHGDTLIAAVPDMGVQLLDGVTATPIGSIGENALDIAIDGDLLYCVSGRRGLAIYDIHDPTAARFVSRVGEDDGFLQLVAAGGGRAVAADETKSIRVFDVSAPETPRAFPPVSQPVKALAASSTRLFVSGSTFDDLGIERGTGIPLRVYDLAQADAPRVVGEVTDLAGPVNGAATDGTLAFISDPPYFRVIDVSTTASPREIASLRLDSIEPFVKSLGSRVILYGSGKVQFIDVSNPYHPRLGGTFESLGRPPSAAAISDNAFLEGNTSSGFHVFDFLPDGSSHFIAGIKTHPVDIVVSGSAAYYIVEFQSVGIADISSGGARLVNAILIPAVQLALSGTLLLVRDSKSVHVLSIADPFAPVELGALPLDRGGVLAADAGAAYVATNGTVLRIDLVNPTAPALQTTGARVVAPAQIAATNGKVVVADRYALRVFGPDTAPPAPPPPAAPPRRRPSRP